MSARKLIRKYPLSDATLKQRGDQLVGSMTRDASDFATRSIGAAERDSLKDLLSTFANTTTDVEEAGQKTAAVEEKNELATNIRKELRTIRGIVSLQYGAVGHYRRFGFAKIDKLTDDGLHRLARRTVRIATELLSELATRGLTTATLNNLAAMAQAFDDAIEAVHEEEAQRVNATDLRITCGNAVWDAMVHYATVGKNLFADTDPARYSHYVLGD